MICNNTTTDKALLYFIICYETAPNNSDSAMKDHTPFLIRLMEYWALEWAENRISRIKDHLQLDFFQPLHNVLLPRESWNNQILLPQKQYKWKQNNL
jgi:hypothetical protein